MMGTTKLQREFVDFARTRGLAHLHNVPGLGRHIPGMAVVIVGSVASGLCEPSSDINLALFADRDAIDRLHVPRWAEGRPTELTLDGRQLQYYGVAIETVEEQLRRLDDIAWYNYARAVVLQDPNGRYRHMLSRVEAELSR